MNSHQVRDRVQLTRIQDVHRYGNWFNTVEWWGSDEIFRLNGPSLGPAESLLTSQDSRLYRTNRGKSLGLGTSGNLNLLSLAVNVRAHDICKVAIHLRSDMFSMNKVGLFYGGQPFVQPWHRTEENAVKENRLVSQLFMAQELSLRSTIQVRVLLLIF